MRDDDEMPEFAYDHDRLSVFIQDCAVPNLAYASLDTVIRNESARMSREPYTGGNYDRSIWRHWRLLAVLRLRPDGTVKARKFNPFLAQPQPSAAPVNDAEAAETTMSSFAVYPECLPNTGRDLDWIEVMEEDCTPHSILGGLAVAIREMKEDMEGGDWADDQCLWRDGKVLAVLRQRPDGSVEVARFRSGRLRGAARGRVLETAG